jgi:hypothetical protein
MVLPTVDESRVPSSGRIFANVVVENQQHLCRKKLLRLAY